MTTQPVNSRDVLPANIAVILDRHSKTIDTGLEGRTVSCGPFGDVSYKIG
jgi:hypothetical protein